MSDFWQLVLVAIVGKWLISNLDFARELVKRKTDRERVERSASKNHRWYTW